MATKAFDFPTSIELSSGGAKRDRIPVSAIPTPGAERRKESSADRSQTASKHFTRMPRAWILISCNQFPITVASQSFHPHLKHKLERNL
jgi:hypothetical protein